MTSYRYKKIRLRDWIKLLNLKLLVDVLKFSKEQGFVFALHYMLGRVYFLEDTEYLADYLFSDDFLNEGE